MSASMQELHENLFKTLLADVQLVNELGGEKVFDRVPERVSPPYIVLGQMSATDWGTSTEDGDAITFTLHVWSKTPGREEAHLLQTHVKRILSQQPMSLPNHHLIHIRPLFSEIRRDRHSAHLHGVIRFRGVTEPRT